MISPETRALLSDALTPPPGYAFDCGMATTYSLDLVSLLAMPLHMAWMATGDDSVENIDPLRALEALRRTSDRFTVFCDRGRLQVPRHASPLLSLLENVVHEVVAPHGGAFHPKMWILRFVPEEGERVVRLRLLVMSRNITNDASWDLSMCLDGTVGRKSEAGGKLAGFIDAVSRLTRKPLSERRRGDIDVLIKEATKAEWELPGSFEDVHFHALGLGRQRRQWLPKPAGGEWNELGVISPFVEAEALQTLAASCQTPLFVVSRADELDQVPDSALENYQTVSVLNEGADQSEAEATQEESLTGLHAKAYIGRAGWYCHLFLGSANATDAALLYGNNVEFMAELVGRHSRVGAPEAWIGQTGMGSLLEPYQRSAVPDQETQEYRDKKSLERLRREIAAQALSLDCIKQEESWGLQLLGLALPDEAGLSVAVWPLTLRIDQAVTVSSDADRKDTVIPGLMKQDITSFIGIRLRLNQAELCFGLDVPLHNAPAGRDIDVLRSVIENREGFVRYLMLLLGEIDLGAGAALTGTGGGRADWRGGGGDGDALFEMLATAYAREPDKLEHIASLITRLQSQSADGTPEIVPQEFQELWNVVSEALKDEKA